MNDSFFKVPYISITPTTVTCYSQLYDSRTMLPYRSLINELPESNIHRGTISKKSYSRIYRRVFTYLYNVDRDILMSGKGREKVGFLTLTLPSPQVKKVHKNWVEFRHSDQEIKSKCLNQFFVELSKNYGLKHKVWKGEKQKNGNIHFHVLIDRFISHTELRERWNRIINKLGYVSRYRDQMNKLTEQQYIELRLREYTTPLSQDKKKKLVERYKKAYKEGVATNWLQPNTTDIHSLYKNKKGKSINNVVAYIAKYMSKSDEFQSDNKAWGFDMQYVKGRIWYCSQLISKACKVVVDMSDDLMNAFEKMCETLKDTYVVTDEYFTVACQSIVKAAKHGICEFDDIFYNNLKILQYESS